MVRAKTKRELNRRTPSPARPEITALISEFSTTERRNDVRGTFADYARTGDRRALTDRLRNNKSATDTYTASRIINSPFGLIGRRVQYLLQSEIPMIHRIASKDSSHEIAYACGFINSWATDASKAIGTISFLSKLTEVDTDDAIAAVRAVVREWGASTYILFKISYLRTLQGLNENQLSQLEEIDSILAHRERPAVQFACLEKVHERVSLFSIARRHTNTQFSNVDGEFRKSHALNTLVYTPFDSRDCASYVLRATVSSLIDCVFSLWVIINLEERFPSEFKAIERFLDPDLLAQLTAGIADAQSAAVRLSKTDTFESEEDSEDRSLTLYRKSAAFLEHKAWCGFRNDIDRVIGFRLVAPLRDASPIDWPAEVFDDKQMLLDGDGVIPLEEYAASPLNVDTFYRTYLFLRFIQNPRNLSYLSEKEFASILNGTMALETLLLEDELERMHLNASDDARALISVLGLALHRSKALDPDIDYNFRVKLEQYIIDNFSGQVPRFVDSIAVNSPQVANYITQSLDEITLQKMYTLIGSPEKSDDVRKELLLSIGARTNRIEFIIEAEAIETRRKVSKIKTYFDSSRMYVDSVAMRKWFETNPSAYTEQVKALLPKIVARLATIKSVHGPSGAQSEVSVITFLETDRHLIRNIAKDGFREFCLNNEFGIESYLGRRIRHNTLHGVMTKAVDDVLSRDDYQSVLIGTPFGRAVIQWESAYRFFLERLRKDFLQFKQHSKPLGFFDAEIDFSDPVTTQNIESLVQSLRVSGAELLHDMIIGFCWKQIAPQLEYASANLRVRLAADVQDMLDSSLGKFNGPEEQKIRGALSEATRSALTQVASWFQLPQTGFVPASVTDICNIIDIEYGRSSNTTLVEGDSPQKKYYGISVHRIYDCLAVLVQNAFKHGELGTQVIVNVSSAELPGTSLARLRVSVISTLSDEGADENIERIKRAISAAETGKEMVTEGYTGIRKVRFITKTNEGSPTVGYTVVGNQVELRFTMKAELAPEGEIDDLSPAS